MIFKNTDTSKISEYIITLMNLYFFFVSTAILLFLFSMGDNLATTTIYTHIANQTTISKDHFSVIFNKTTDSKNVTIHTALHPICVSA